MRLSLFLFRYVDEEAATHSIDTIGALMRALQHLAWWAPFRRQISEFERKNLAWWEPFIRQVSQFEKKNQPSLTSLREKVSECRAEKKILILGARCNNVSSEGNKHTDDNEGTLADGKNDYDKSDTHFFSEARPGTPVAEVLRNLRVIVHELDGKSPYE